jgi:hypothetical protein
MRIAEITHAGVDHIPGRRTPAYMLSNVLVLRRHRCITLLKHESVLELSSFGVMTSSVERFKWNRLAAWKRLVAEGFSPEQIVNAYAAPAESYWLRNRDDPALA